MREVLGYTLAVIAVLIAFGGVWAAGFYAPRRRYARVRSQERRSARARTKIGEGANHRTQRTPENDAKMDLNACSTCGRGPGCTRTDHAEADAVDEFV